MIRVADLFCGAGGESTGILQAMAEAGEKVDLAAVNHWDVAIDTHTRNHPKARHFCASIQTLNPLEVFRARDKVDLLWASPECTHHSNARGGRPCSDQGRASSWLTLKWLSELYVRRVILENVPEFTNWGPLGADGRPLASRRGASFEAFLSALRSLGYRVEWQMLCSANYGAATTRTRFFLQAVRGGGRITWPEPTHAERPGLLGEKAWTPARDIIDWNLRGESIRDRKRPLAPATMARIEAGIKRYWGEWAEPFLVLLRGTGTTRDMGKPLPAMTAGGQHLGLVQPFVLHQMTPGRPRQVEEPLPTITGHSGHALVEPLLVTLTHGGRISRLDKPMPTVTCAHRGEQAVIEPFILPPLGYHHRDGKANRARGMKQPLQTVTSRGGGHVVEPFLVHYYGNGQSAPVRVPLATLTSKDHFGLVEGQPVGLDVTFRMLKPHELAAAMSFPKGYDFAGNISDKVKQIGNAVEIKTAHALAMSALVAA